MKNFLVGRKPFNKQGNKNENWPQSTNLNVFAVFKLIKIR